MKSLHWLLCGVLGASLLHTSIAQAWQIRGGGGARTFVVPHNGGHPPPPPMPQPQPQPGPKPYPQPHTYPPPRPMPPPPPPPPPPDNWYHPWAAAAVVGATTATAIAIGSQVASVPPDCVSVVANNVAYQHCGATWYQPRYVGGNVQFVVVPAPW